eukprot:1043059-Rhodomonas_salina.1
MYRRVPPRFSRRISWAESPPTKKSNSPHGASARRWAVASITASQGISFRHVPQWAGRGPLQSLPYSPRGHGGAAAHASSQSPPVQPAAHAHTHSRSSTVAAKTTSPTSAATWQLVHDPA